MNFFTFQKLLSSYPVFSLQDVSKLAPYFHRIQLDRWEKKGYLKKIKRGYYSLVSDRIRNGISQNFLFYTANRIYSPSYVSLSTGLKFYGLIPEEIFQITSVTTKKMANFKTAIGNFSYRQVKPSLFWGYKLVDYGAQKILLADLEKALLDYIYLHPHLKTADDFREMRINREEFREHIDIAKCNKYMNAFESKSLTKRANLFLNTMHHDYT